MPKYILIVVIFIVTATISLLSIKKNDDEFCITKANRVATATEDDLDEAVAYVRNHQRNSLLRMIDNGRTIVLQPGTKVKKVAQSENSEKIFIEILGEKIGVWTMSDSIVCNKK